MTFLRAAAQGILELRTAQRKEEPRINARKVFIPQLPTRFDKATNTRVPAIDVNPAAQFGELVQIFSIDISREEALTRTRDRAALEHNRVGPDDFILAVGDITLLALVVTYALMHNGRATLLRWDGDAKLYKQEEIHL
jgi:hypothetical protein